MTKVFVDGSAGTTGLRIVERLQERKDISLITLSEALRKDSHARKEVMHEADVIFLCLPDAAAMEAVELAKTAKATIIDTSTAHRVQDGWAYGFPELTGNTEAIKASKFIANPGCHASGFISLVAPLTEAGILPKDSVLSCTSLTGYSGGGKKMIAQYENEKETLLTAPRMYGLTQNHKHIPEMVKYAHLEKAPVFCPVVAPYYAGMQVTVPLLKEQIKGSIEDIKEIYKKYYQGKLVFFEDNADEEGFYSAISFAGRDDMQISVCGNEDRMVLVSRFDNLGKGASGAAIQNMNLILGLDEATGLTLKGETT